MNDEMKDRYSPTGELKVLFREPSHFPLRSSVHSGSSFL